MTDILSPLPVVDERVLCGERAVLTIATGRAVYWKMALELARSFERWNRHNDISLVIITDSRRTLPKSLSKTIVHAIEDGSLPKAFGSKLTLDKFAPARRTLFIDADCLCVSNLEPIFERFAGYAVSVVGGRISTGEWWGDVAATCARTGISGMTRFNGGVYYVEPGDAATAVFERARALEPQYDDLGLVRLRGSPNDEPLMAIAMAQSDCWGIPDDGSIMGDLFSTPQVVEFDVLRGRCTLRNPAAPSPLHRTWFPLKEIQPAIVHFLGQHVTSRAYRRETLKLRLAAEGNMPVWAARIVGWAYDLPLKIIEMGKDLFRPTYRKFFGYRKVSPPVR